MTQKTTISLLLTLLLAVGTSLSALGHSDAPTLLEDINKDGVVNIQDLVLISAAFGQARDRTAAHDPDVNRDGTINVLDLIRVSNRFGETNPDENTTYHDIQAYVFDQSCASSACHAAPATAANLDLTYGVSYANLVGEEPRNPAAATAGMKLVDPGNPENSFLFAKLVGPTDPEHGARMPIASNGIHAGKIEAVRAWIDAGAPQTGRIAGIGDLSVLRDPDETFEPPAPPPPGEGYQLHLPAFNIEPGTELEIFYATQIRDENGDTLTEDIFINRVEIFYPSGSHHFILYRLTEEALAAGVDQRGITPDIGVESDAAFRVLDPQNPQVLGNFGVDRIFVVGTQTDDTVFQFPEGVGLRLPGDTTYDLNSHYINLLGDETLVGETYVNIYTIPEEEVRYEAVEIFASNQSINVPPGTTRVTKKTVYVEDELDSRGHAAAGELNIFLLSSHMHRHGELFEIFQDSTGDLLHRSVAYDDAPLTIFEPVLRLDSDDAIQFQCTHNNYDKTEPLAFGFTSEDEMCIIFGYYYVAIDSAGDITR